MRYPIAPNGIFRSVQGEGQLLGTPMTFIRLAGCSIGCPACDTDYRVDRRMEVSDIVQQVVDLTPGRWPWVWITGGEPTDHNLFPLVQELHAAGIWIALATAGTRELPLNWSRLYHWVSVSPHNPNKWLQRQGSELKLVPGLNGFFLSDFAAEVEQSWFGHRFVQPCEGKPETVAECFQWLEQHPGWRMTTQAHKQWGLA